MRIDWRRGLILLLWSPALAALAQDAPWMVNTVHGYRVGLAVKTVRVAGRPTQAPEHLLLVSVREAASGRAAATAAVSADVAESGYSGMALVLSPLRAGGDLYEARMKLETGTMYRILVRVTPAGGGRALEAQFYYRHHH